MDEDVFGYDLESLVSYAEMEREFRREMAIIAELDRLELKYGEFSVGEREFEKIIQLGGE